MRSEDLVPCQPRPFRVTTEADAKDTDLSRWSSDDLAAIAHTLNTRPRKTLGWRTPAEALDEQLRSIEQAGVATTG
jgi:hypothetical protein